MALLHMGQALLFTESQLPTPPPPHPKSEPKRGSAWGSTNSRRDKQTQDAVWQLHWVPVEVRAKDLCPSGLPEE